MKDDILHSLERYYSNLRDALTLKAKVKNIQSVIISLFNIKSNTAYEVLKEASIRITTVPKLDYEMLLSREYIRETDLPGYSVITAKGVWEYEIRKESATIDQLIESIDSKYFDVFEKTKPLTEKEKIIILTMISVRSFSEDTAIDLKKNPRILEVLEKLIYSVYDLLKTNGVIVKLDRSKVFGDQGNEHPVSNLIRHTDGLVKKTRGIYKSRGKQCYYLDLLKDSEISEVNLTFLFELLCGKTISDALIYSIKDVCTKNAYEESVHLFDFSKTTFISPQYDNVISKCIEKCAYSY